LRRNCLLEHILKEKQEEKSKGRQGRRRKQLLMTFKETRGFCKLKAEALDRTLWRTLFERGYGHVTRQRRNECMGMYEKDQ
jgi:hypothetical protein